MLERIRARKHLFPRKKTSIFLTIAASMECYQWHCCDDYCRGGYGGGVVVVVFLAVNVVISEILFAIGANQIGKLARRKYGCSVVNV